MRTFSILRALVLVTALSAPLAQAALASEQEQQAMTDHNAVTTAFYGGGTYDNDAVMSPSVGN